MTTFQDAFNAAEQELGESEGEAVAVDEGSDAVGQVEENGTDVVAGDEKSYFDLDQYGDQVVRIKVDGVDSDVPVSELRNGYMRQSAFTQKTQELAQERARLQSAESLAAAYERNPQETIRFLAQQNGLTFAEAKAQAEDAAGEQAEGWANDGYVDPRYEALDQRLAAFEQTQARSDLEREVTRLGNLYGEDFNPNEVINEALKLGRSDLDGVYKQIAFDRLYARKGAEEEVAQRAAAETAARTAAKQQLASTVASGQSANGAGSTASTSARTVAQAMEQAAAEHGWDFD